MKTTLTIFFALAAIFSAFAGESGLTQTVQPLDGLGAGEVILAPVMCYDWNAQSGLPTAIGLITAKNIPPTNAPKPIEDINVASACGLVFDYGEDSAGRGVVTLDCRALHIPQRFGCTELQIVGATLECLRQVIGPKLDTMTGDAQISLEGDLSHCSFPPSVGRIPEESSLLRRQTVSPVLDYAILELDQQTLRPILDTILPDNRFMEDIIHIQIAQHGAQQFGSYDQFHHECIVCFLGVPTKFLDELKQRGIIRSWTTPHEDARRWHG